jgi:hypothetical protein
MSQTSCALPRNYALKLGLLAALVALACACAVDNPPQDWAPVQRASFECAVQPIFARECSMPDCHGNSARRLQILAPGRMRLAAELTKALAAQPAEEREAGHHPLLTPAEIDFNFAQARSMVIPGQAPEDSALLNRPLAVAAGGMYHVEAGDVFASALDLDYVTLQVWIEGAGKEMCK